MGTRSNVSSHGGYFLLGFLAEEAVFLGAGFLAPPLDLHAMVTSLRDQLLHAWLAMRLVTTDIMPLR